MFTVLLLLNGSGLLSKSYQHGRLEIISVLANMMVRYGFFIIETCNLLTYKET